MLLSEIFNSEITWIREPYPYILKVQKKYFLKLSLIKTHYPVVREGGSGSQRNFLHLGVK